MVVVNPGKLIVEIRHHRQQAGFCSSFFSLFSFTLIHGWIYIPMVEFMPSIGVGRVESSTPSTTAKQDNTTQPDSSLTKQ